MRPLAIEAGQRFGKLSVIREVAKIGQYRAFELKCDCGNIAVVKLNALHSSRPTRSCGCLLQAVLGNRRTHGRSATPFYRIWQGMLKRCENPTAKRYADYGGRGIKVCARWHSFENFLADMGEPPSRAHQIDRHPDNDGDYEPGNARWATRSEQAHNRRKNQTAFGLAPSRYKGVDWWASNKGWRARISIDGKTRYLGLHHSQEEAARAYDAVARLHGFPLNFPDKDQGD